MSSSESAARVALKSIRFEREWKQVRVEVMQSIAEYLVTCLRHTGVGVRHRREVMSCDALVVRGVGSEYDVIKSESLLSLQRSKFGMLPGKFLPIDRIFDRHFNVSTLDFTSDSRIGTRKCLVHKTCTPVM